MGYKLLVFQCWEQQPWDVDLCVSSGKGALFKYTQSTAAASGGAHCELGQILQTVLQHGFASLPSHKEYRVKYDPWLLEQK